VAFTAFASDTPVAPQQPKRRGRVALLLLLPGLAYLAIFFLAPLVSLILTSLQRPAEFGDFGQYEYAFNIDNYADVLGAYGGHIVRSVLYSGTATVAALLLGYPLAYFIAVTLRRWPLWQGLALTLVIAPFFISFLLRTLAWKQILSDEGPVVSFLQLVAVLPEGARLTGTDFSVIFGLTYNFLPFMVLPIYASLASLDLRLLEASRDLYANAWSSFWRVTVPLSLPGIVSGTLLVFIPAAGDYVNASLDFLGGTSTAMVGNVIETLFIETGNYPEASALSVILMALILVPVAFYVLFTRTEDLI
jgi:spermidine/putrescine transport system permease protein